MSSDIGIKPIEFKVLVKVEEVKDQSAGGIYLPDSSWERQELANDRGTIVAMSDGAFFDWMGETPEVGDKVIFSKYAGTIIDHQKGKDAPRERYRLCNDKDICAIIKE